MNAFRSIYRFWVSLMTLAVVVQIGFAGYGAFTAAHKASKSTLNDHAFSHGFNAHAALGTILVPAALLLLLISLGTLEKRRILQSLGVFVLFVAQMLLGWTGASAPYILGALHPINAFLILGFLGSIAYREWKGGQMGTREPAAPPPA
jgi:hypothetical protein